ncbi:glycosyltransferase [Alcaligenes ammonioxydans]|uniref:glycosyltransferase n=1 Tax=Alcaligenes ammonioxydans TaxID=2582914 RepID=UPI003D2189C3
MADLLESNFGFGADSSNILAEHVLLTRFGIGITDPKWISIRLSLFKSITLPGVVSQNTSKLSWFIFVDKSWPSEFISDLLLATQDFDFIKIIKIDFYFEYSLISEKLIADSISVFGNCLVSKIDDDDGISIGCFDKLYELRGGFFALVFSNGYEFLCQNRILKPSCMPFLTMNTHFDMSGLDDLKYLRIGHHRVAEFLFKENRKLHVHSEGRFWIYSRHKYSDSRFSAVRKNILENKRSRAIGSADYRNFSIDFLLLQDFRSKSALFNGVPNEKTWLRQAKLNEEAEFFYKKLLDTKRLIDEVGSNVIQ